MRRIHILLLSLVFLVFGNASASENLAQPVTFQALLERSTASPDSMMRYGGEEPQFIELDTPAFSLVLRVLQHLHSEHTPIVREE